MVGVFLVRVRCDAVCNVERETAISQNEGTKRSGLKIKARALESERGSGFQLEMRMCFESCMRARPTTGLSTVFVCHTNIYSTGVGHIRIEYKITLFVKKSIAHAV